MPVVNPGKADKPRCPCHGQEMRRHGSRDGWRCAVKQRGYSNKYRLRRYRELVEAGICGDCGKQPACVGVRCLDCTLANLERNAFQLG